MGSSFKEGYETSNDMPKDDPVYKSTLPFSEHTPWPQANPGEDNAPYEKFRKVMQRYQLMLLEASLDLIKLIAMGLGLNENFFDCLFTKPMNTLRIMNYPVHDFEPPQDAYTSDGKLVSTEQHKDSGIITLLTTFGNEGLQVRLLTGGCVLVSPGFFGGGGGGGGVLPHVFFFFFFFFCKGSSFHNYKNTTELAWYIRDRTDPAFTKDPPPHTHTVLHTSIMCLL